MNKKTQFMLAAVCVLAVLALVIGFLLPAVRIHIAERAALSQLGKPYAFGTAGPDSFDCSGLMKLAYARAGVSLDHSTQSVSSDSRFTTISDSARLRRGDLVFFDTIANSREIDHVGFWLGRGRFVHASSASGEVIISEFDERWQERFVLAKRIL